MSRSHPPHNLSIFKLMEMFPDEKSAEDWLIKTRWGGEVCCPKCGSVDIIHRKTRRPQPYRCRDCRRYFSVKTDSLMHSSPLTCRQWVFAIFFFVHSKKGISSVQLGKHLGIQQKSAWHLLHRLRENFVESWPLIFDGAVEIDESYLGQKFRTMHAKKRKENRLKPHYGKSIVVGMRDRSTGRVTAQVVPDVTHKTLSGFIREHARDGTCLYTDEGTGYEGLPNRSSVNHSKGQYVSGNCHTNGIESFWALLKRSQHGVYHWWSKRHLPRYLAEACGRFNLRYLTGIEQMEAVVRGLDCKRLTLERLVG